MESQPEFDVVAVVGRLASFPVPGAPVDALDWADRAADRVKRWAEALQAEVIHERELAVMFPPLPSLPDPDEAGGDGARAPGDADQRPDDAASTGTCAAAGGGEAGDVGTGGGDVRGDDAEARGDGEAPHTAAGGCSGRDEAPPVDVGELPSLGGPAPPASVQERERVARRSWVLSVLRAIAAAFRAGRVSTAHVDVLAAMLHDLDDRALQCVIARENDLLSAARSTSVEVFRRQVRNLVDRSLDDEGESRLRSQRPRSFLKHWVRDADQMHCGYFELDPARGAALFAALEAEITALYASGAAKGLDRKQVAAQALCNIQTRGEFDLAAAGSTGDCSCGGPTSEAAGPVGTERAHEPTNEQARDQTDGAPSAPRPHEPAPGCPPTGPAGTTSRNDPAQASAPASPATGGGSGTNVRRRGAGVLGRRRSAPWRANLIVIVDAQTLRGGQHDHTVCETWSGEPFPPALARELLYEAQVTYGLTFDGRVVGMSSGQRLATFQQRKALRIMYRTCAFPGCQVDFDECEVHHVVHVTQHGGTTIIETLVPLCRRRGGHHDLIHDGGWRARIDGLRTLTWLTPNGDVHAVTPFTPLADLDLIAASGAPPSAGGVAPGTTTPRGRATDVATRRDPASAAGRRRRDGAEIRDAPPGPPPPAAQSDARRRRVVSAPTLFESADATGLPAA